MSTTVRNRLLTLGVVWGALLTAVPALVMTRPYRLSGFLVAALACAVLSGVVGTLVAGRRAAVAGSGDKRKPVVAALRTGPGTGLVGGAVVGLLIWAVMAVTLSGFTLENPVEVSKLMRPSVFLDSFFVSLSVFLYSLVGGLVLGPVFGTLVNRAASQEAGS